MTSETQLDNQHVRWIEVLGFILSPYKPASTKDRTSIVVDSDSHQTIQPNLRPAPEQAKRFLQSPNTTGGVWGLEHKPEGMKTDAPSISPSRWEN